MKYCIKLASLNALLTLSCCAYAMDCGKCCGCLPVDCLLKILLGSNNAQNKKKSLHHVIANAAQPSSPTDDQENVPTHNKHTNESPQQPQTKPQQEEKILI